MKITWYVLLLLVFIVLICSLSTKILEGHRKAQKWQSEVLEKFTIWDNLSSVQKSLILSVDSISFFGSIYHLLGICVFKW